ncbi:hypothetical protein [Caudoviricetes sp.]|nr:hypothetical protein [Caudoviricetes sp.]UOF82768.1 hypothetical protein [Caudoviricetes sp.]
MHRAAGHGKIGTRAGAGAPGRREPSPCSGRRAAHPPRVKSRNSQIRKTKSWHSRT